MNSKIAVVAKREFLTTVRRKAYLITTFGMPVFLLLYAGIAMLPAMIMAKKEAQTRTVGILDASRLFGLDKEIEFTPPAPPQLESFGDVQVRSSKGVIKLEDAFADATKVRLRPFTTKDAAEQALRSGEIASFYEFPGDYLKTGRVTSYSKPGVMPGTGGQGKQDLLRRFVIERLLAGKLDPELMERVRRPLRVTSMLLQKGGGFEPENVSKIIGSFVLPFAFTMLFFISVMMSSGFLLQGVSEEKENRVIEVILSSIDSDGLLLGKLIGLGGAGLLQVFIWFGLVLVMLPLAVATLTLPGGIPVRFGAVAISFVFYLLGFLLFGILLTGTGSLGQNLKESQQLGMIWSMGSIIPMVFMMLIVSEPNGVVARVLSFIPLTAPVTMFLRLNSTEPPPAWEIALAAVVLAAAVWLSLRIMGKIFRVGLLLYGKRPTLPEIFKLLRRPSA